MLIASTDVAPDRRWRLWRGRRGRALLKLPTLCGAAIVMCACSRATILKPSVNDALREENQQLRDEVARLSLEVGELRSRIAQRDRAIEARADGIPAGVDAAVEEATPRIAAVQIDSATELVRPGGDPAAGVLRLWVKPRDGRGRFHQMVGRLTVGATILRAGRDPLPVVTASFGPTEVRDAWRSGFMGAHYAFTVPMPIPAELQDQPVTVSIRFEDLLTGRSFEDQARVAPPRQPAASLGTNQ